MTQRQSFAPHHTRPERLRHAISPRRATALVVVGLLLGALLTAPALLDTARRQPFGTARTVMVQVTEHLAAVSSATRLDVPWRTLDALVHPTSGTPSGEVPPAPAPPAVGAPSPDASAAPAPAPSASAPATPDPSPSTEAEPSEPAASPSTAPEADPAMSGTARVPSVDDPLRVWVTGDSMWERPGPKLVAALEATGVVDVVELEFRYSTGLTRPDYFDWPAHAAAQLEVLEPEVVLVLLGPNDSQPLIEGGVRHEPRTDGFNAAYAARVRTMMEVLAAETEHVIWVGLPIMREAGFDQRMHDLDMAYANQAAAVDGVDHLPTRALFADATGDYAEYLPGPDGSLQPMRNQDGIHLSENGSARLVRYLVDHLDARHELTD